MTLACRATTRRLFSPPGLSLRNRTLVLMEVGQVEVGAEAVEVETQAVGVAAAKVTSGNCFAIAI